MLGKALAEFQRSLLATNSPFDRFRLHAEGVNENPLLAQPDTGAGRYRFRTPTLRNVALTAPYMHNGMLASLEDVLGFYDNGRSENPNGSSICRGRGSGPRRGARQGPGRGGTPSVDRDFRRVANMSDQQMRDIVAFLEALTDEDFDRVVPDRVPSGLAPGWSSTLRPRSPPRMVRRKTVVEADAEAPATVIRVAAGHSIQELRVS